MLYEELSLYEAVLQLDPTILLSFQSCMSKTRILFWISRNILKLRKIRFNIVFFSWSISSIDGL